MARIKESKEKKQIVKKYNKLRALEQKRLLTTEENDNLQMFEYELFDINSEHFKNINISKQRKKLQPEFELIEQINALIKEVGGRDFKARELRLFNVLIKDLSAANLTRIFRDMK